ncbi:MAG: LrgB family protein [Ruminococcaceae bacterium]|nr:LrgB family protein [Oscillospiraceae bacterium]
MLNESLFFGFAASLGAYLLGIQIKKRTGISWLNPLLTSVVLLIAVLVLFRIPFADYSAGAGYLSYFLTPATVCLAIPLYRQFSLLKKYPLAILGSITAGVLASMGSIFLLCVLFGSDMPFFISMLPKSITTAIGMGIAEELGGIPEISVASIVLTGIFGNIIGVGVCKLFKIKEPMAVGLALGTASHAIGTAKALELGEVESAMSSLSITVAGLITVLLSSLFVSGYPL